MTLARLLAPVRFSLVLLIAATFASTSPASAQTPARSTLGGHVTDDSGGALARVPVTLLDASERVVTTTLTDASGWFRFDGPCRNCRARVVLPGFVSAVVSVSDEVDAVLALSIAPIREAVVVTATRGEAPTSQVGASVTVFDADAIERRGVALVGDLLRLAPGAAVVQNGGQGNVTSLFVRGGENNYTKVLLDGIALNEPGGAFNFGGLSTGHLERIEFVRGAQSALFGSDAMAGVIQLVSRRGQAGARPSWSGELGAGGYGTTRGSATLTGGVGRWDYSVHGSRYGTDNRAANNAFRSSTISMTGGGALTDTVTLRLVGRYEDGRTGAPGQTAFGRPDLDATFTQSHLIGGVSIEQHVTPRFTQRLTYSLARSAQRSTNLLFDEPYTPSYKGHVAPFEFYDFTYDSGSRFTRHQAGYQADLRLSHGGAIAGAEFLTLAVDWDGERATLTDYGDDTRSTPRRDNVGATLQHQHISRWFSLTTGVRAERNAHFGTAVVPRASAALFLRHGSGRVGATTLKGNAGRGIKEPTMRQSFSLSPYDLGNSSLEAERSRTVDAGLEQRLFDDRVKVEAVWFDNRFDQQISTRTISFSPYLAQYVNVGLTQARGAEVQIEAVPVNALRVNASYTFTDSNIVEAASEFSDVLAAGHWALRRPRHAAQVAALWERGSVSADGAGTYVGRWSDSDFSSLEPALTSAGGYWLWRAQVQWRVRPEATMFLRIENLTDREYMEPLGYPAWRRTVHGGLRVRF